MLHFMTSEPEQQLGVGTQDAFQRLWTPHRMAYIQGENKPTGPGADDVAVVEHRHFDAFDRALHDGILQHVEAEFLRLFPRLAEFSGLGAAAQAVGGFDRHAAHPRRGADVAGHGAADRDGFGDEVRLHGGARSDHEAVVADFDRPLDLTVDRCSALLAAGLAEEAAQETVAALSRLPPEGGIAYKKAEVLFAAATATLAAGHPVDAKEHARRARRLFRRQDRLRVEACTALVLAEARYAAVSQPITTKVR